MRGAGAKPGRRLVSSGCCLLLGLLPIVTAATGASGAVRLGLREAAAPVTTLTVPVVGPWDRLPGDGFPATIVIRAPGRPPTVPSTLVSADGTEEVVALPASMASCNGVAPRDIGLVSTSEWCLHLTGLTPGDSVTGMVVGSSVIVDLTVEPRDPWFPWPALIVAIGVFLAALVLVAPAIITRRVLKLELWRVLERNEREGTISGLDRKWVESLVTDGRCTIEPVFADVIVKVITNGPTQLSADRARLRSLIALSLLPHDKTLLIAAREQAKEAPPRREDFFTDGGKPCEAPPEKWLQRVSRAERIAANIDRLRRRLVEVRDTEERNRLESSLNQLADQVAEAGPEGDVVDNELTSAGFGVGEASRAIRGAVDESVGVGVQVVPAEIEADQPPFWFKVVMGGATALQWLLFPRIRTGPYPGAVGLIDSFPTWYDRVDDYWGFFASHLEGFSRWRYTVLVWLSYYGVAAVLMVLAAAAVFSISFINTGAFGTLADYFKLGGAAFGTTAVTGIVGLLPRRMRS
jgi:hypothetical protein